MNSARRTRLQRGFTLLEVMLATALFSLVLVSFAMLLNRSIDASIDEHRESDVRINLETRLAEARQGFLQEGKEELEPDSYGVQYNKEVQLLKLKNEKGQELFGLYNLTIRAHWQRSGEEEERKAEVMIFQP